jgi:hypothetical protein
LSNLPNYLPERLDPQIKWYEKKASANKSRFHASQLVIIIASAIIPIVNVIDFAPVEIRIVSSILGGIIIGFTGFIQLKKYQENWILFRTTEEILKKEKYFFVHNVGEYANVNSPEDKNKLLVERVESIISSETSRFFTMHRQKPHLSDEKTS